MTNLREPDLEVLARAWLAADPDPITAAATQQLLETGGAELERVFAQPLRFGTAGLRGRLGPGPANMNRVLVRVVAAAIAQHVGTADAPHVVVGYDGRHGSADFAHDSARVFAARGVRCTLLPGPLPTPVLAFAVRHLDADAGVMVTASHNPRDDNGYKVYGPGGTLITSPVDQQIADAMDTLPLLTDADLAPIDDPAVTVAGDDLVATYVDTITAGLDPRGSRSARVAYTALHGVGTGTVTRAFAAAGFPAPAVVEEQARPDPDFPTTPFPNPEESGVLDLLLALASEAGADVALANDPDADRLAVAVRNGPEWRLLSGDDLGCLLAEHLLTQPTDDARTPLVITTVTSSRLLAEIAKHHGATHAETLTGFKWIMDERNRRPDHRLVIGYEEALGYAVNDEVRDKDGVSAALVVAELVGKLRDERRSLLDLLDDLHVRHGVHRGGQRSIRFEATADDVPVMAAAMDAMRRHPPESLAGRTVRSIADLSKGESGLPPTNGIVLDLDGVRVVIRPSGTEPKMKVYVEAVVPVADNLAAARAEAATLLRTVTDAAVTHVADAERADPPSTTAEAATHDRAAALFSAAPPVGAARAHDLRRIVTCIDLTTLEGSDTPGRIRALCAQARRPDPSDPTVGPTAAVCVYPELVPIARELLDSTEVRVASVAGAFPSGLSAVAVRDDDIADAAERGAQEIDVVLNRSAFLSGHFDRAAAELASARAAARDADLKVIIEVGELGSLDAIRHASRLAIEAGADFVKTSTGKTAVNATPPAVLAMLEEISAHADRTGKRIGIKIAGGVRTAGDALAYVALVRGVLGDGWLAPELFRFGASSLLESVLADLAATESALRAT